MKCSHLLSLTTVALLAASSALACPKQEKHKSPGQDGPEEGVYEVSTEVMKAACKNKGKEGSDEGVYEVAEREGDAKPAERPERPERGERGERPERGEGPFAALGLSDEQKEQVKEIMDAAREESKAVLEGVKAKKEAGEEIDREAVRTQMMEIREAAMKKVYDTVLTEEQQAKADEHRKAMEERLRSREGKEGERPARPERKERGGDSGLDL